MIDWFARNRGRVDAYDTDVAALLSTLLPEKRTDRVYCIQASKLEKIIGRALMLGSSRIAELNLYRQPGSGIDIADSVERILNTTVSSITSNLHASFLWLTFMIAKSSPQRWAPCHGGRDRWLVA